MNARVAAVKGGPSVARRAAWVAALFVLFGVVWFGLLSLGTYLAYDPLGIQAGEVGLTTGALINETLMRLTIVAGPAITLYVMAEVAIRVAQRARGGSPVRAAALLTTIPSLLVMVIASYLLANACLFAKDDVTKGDHEQIVLGVRVPWNARIVGPLPLDGHPLKYFGLTYCSLLLGQADGVLVFYDDLKHTVVRVPTSRIGTNGLPLRRRCLVDI